VIHLKEATVRDPNLLEAHALLGTAYMHMNKPALAVPELQKLSGSITTAICIFSCSKPIGHRAIRQQPRTH
jgi:hypothetical protein